MVHVGRCVVYIEKERDGSFVSVLLLESRYYLFDDKKVHIY